MQGLTTGVAPARRRMGSETQNLAHHSRLMSPMLEPCAPQRADSSGGSAMSAASIETQRPIAWLPVLTGGLIIAVGDFMFATTLWFAWNVQGLIRLFQTIAVGVLGKASYDGGVAAAWLGAGLHLFIATMFVVAYTLVGRRAPVLLRKPFVYGPAYGVLLYAIMNFAVLPLSRVGSTPSLKHLDWIMLSIVAHMVFGVICVLSARRALQWRGRSA